MMRWWFLFFYPQTAATGAAAGPGGTLDAFLLEDGTSGILLEDGTSDLLMES